MAKRKTKKEKQDEKSFELAKFWLEQVDFAEKETRSWFKRGNDIVKRYRDERTRADEATLRRLNVLWTNIKVLKPALYGKKPIPVIERRFLQRDPVGRLSAIMLERATRNQLDDNGLHESLNRAVMDYLLVGRGIVWLRYESEMGDSGSLPILTQSGVEDELEEITNESDTEEDNKLESTNNRLMAEQVPVDYIDWHDFLTFPCKARVWNEVQAVGKRVYLSKKEAKERFGNDIGNKLKGDTTPIGQSSNRQSYAETPLFRDINERNIVIYEIWNKTDRKIYWVSPGYDYLVDVKDDFLKLKKFFPVPEPICSTLTNNSLIPVPDYYEYQDQAVQIDELTQRLAMLTKACKVAGTYDNSNAALKRLLTEGVENELLPVDAWAAHAEKGGVKGSISFLPFEEIQKVIQTLQEVRQNLMQDLDLVTGISDVIRGTTDSRETLGGIRLKNNNAGTRLSDRQNEVARFARDTIAIIAEIIAKHFEDKTIVQSSGILYDDELSPEVVLEDFYANLPPDIEEQVNKALQQQAQLEQQSQQQQPLQLTYQPQQQPGAAAQPSLQQPVPQPPQQAPMQPQGPSMQPPQQQQASPLAQLASQPSYDAGGQQSGINVLKINSQTLNVDPIALVEEKINKSLKLIRSDVPRGYRIEIETDSTIFGDAMQERQDAIEFITATMQFLTQSSEIAQNLPEMTPLLGRFMQFGVRKFRVGRDLESSIDLFVRQMDKKAKNAIKNPQQSPEQIKANLEQQKANASVQAQHLQMQGDQQKHQLEMQAQHVNDQRDMQKAHMEDQREAQLQQMEIALKQKEHELKMQEMQLKHQIAMAELGAKQQQMQQQAHIESQQNQQKMAQSQMQMQQDQQQHQQTMQLSQQEHSQATEQANTQHQQTMQQTKLQGQQANAQHNQKMSQMKMQATEKDKARKDKVNKPKGNK